MFIKDKLSYFLELIKFYFLPRNKVLATLLVLNIVVFVFLMGRMTFAQSAVASFIDFDSIVSFVNRLLFIVAYALGWLVGKVFSVIVVVSSYNDFVNSAAVNKGWVMLRDICNMLFVIVLLVIAFGEILHIKNYNVKTYLPKVVMAAVLVNFSKLICAVLVDGAQVAMMTFVNGYQATAGANLTVGLGLTKMMKFNELPSEQMLKVKVGVSPTDVSLAIILTICLLIATLFVVVFIALILIVRIVTIWFLIITSPIAFLSGSVPVKQIESLAGQWWQKFGSTVAIGPIMAFFLWLSLSIMADPASMYQSNTSAIEVQAGGTTTEIAKVDNLIQFGMGLAMLLASLYAAQQAGGAIGAIASKGLDYGKKAVKSAGKWVASPVTDRASALYQGYAETRKKKAADRKESIAKTWGGAGRRISRVQDATLGGVKRAAGAPITFAGALAGAGLGTVKGAKALMQGKGVESLAKEIEQGVRAGLNVGGFGERENRSVRSARAASLEASQKEADKRLSAMNLDDGSPEAEEALRLMLTNTNESADLRRAAGLKLKGKYSTREEIEAMRGLLKENTAAGDFKTVSEFEDDVLQKRPDLAFDYSKPLSAADKKKFDKAVKKGKITLQNAEPDSLSNEQFLAAFQSADKKVFGKQVSAVGEADEPLKVAALQAGLRKGMDSAPDKKDHRATMVRAGIKIGEVFGAKDADGKVKTDSAGHAILDPALAPEIAQAVKALSPKGAQEQIRQAKAGSTELKQITVNLDVSQMETMETAELDKVVVELKLDPTMNEKLAEISSNAKLMNKLSPAQRADVVTTGQGEYDTKIRNIEAEITKATGKLTGGVADKPHEAEIQALTAKKLKLQDERAKIK